MIGQTERRVVTENNGSCQSFVWQCKGVKEHEIYEACAYIGSRIRAGILPLRMRWNENGQSRELGFRCLRKHDRNGEFGQFRQSQGEWHIPVFERLSEGLQQYSI